MALGSYKNHTGGHQPQGKARDLPAYALPLCTARQ